MQGVPALLQLALYCCIITLVCFGCIVAMHDRNIYVCIYNYMYIPSHYAKVYACSIYIAPRLVHMCDTHIITFEVIATNISS